MVDIERQQHALAAPLATLVLLVAVSGCKDPEGKAPAMRDGGVGEGPLFEKPSALACLGTGRVLVADASDEAMLKEVELETGRRRLVSGRSRGDGPYFAAPAALEVSADGQFAYALATRFIGMYAEEIGGALVRIDLSSGDRAVVSGFEHGEGEAFREPVDLALLDDDRALVADAQIGLLQVQLVNGARTVLARRGADLRPEAGFPTSLALRSEDSAWFGTRVVDAVSDVELATGESAELSSDRVGEGVSLGIPIALQWSEALGALVVLDSAEGLMLLEPESGDRTWLSGVHASSGEERGDGPQFGDPSDFCEDEAQGQLIVTDAKENALLAVEQDSGNRRIVSY